MSTINEVDDNITTDALPNPRKNSKPQTESNRPTSNDKQYFEEEPIKNNNTQNNFNPNANPKPANITMINVSHSSHVHVGANNTVVLNKRDLKKKYIMTDAVKTLIENQTPLTTSQATFISLHIGEGWKEAARRLNYSEGQINQLHIDNHVYGTKEVIYQFLLDWMQNEPKHATIGKLAQVLWDVNERDAVLRWSKENL